MCVHKRESNKLLNKLHNDMNKKRAAERRGVGNSGATSLRKKLQQEGHLYSQSGE